MLTLLKNFQIEERFNAQFRAESFDFLNQPDFGDPGKALGSADFGTINSAMDGRTLQLGVRIQF